MNIKQLKEECQGMVGMDLGGILKKIYDRKSGTSVKDGKSYDWSFQNLVLSDETGEITVTLKNRDAFNATLGGLVTCQSVRTEKHGNQGVKIEKETYTNKEGKEVSTIKAIVTPSAIITVTPPNAPEVKADEEAPLIPNEEEFIRDTDFDKEIADENKSLKEFLKELHELIDKWEEYLIRD